MSLYANDVHPVPPDHGAPDCDDQLPMFSRVGRGLKGDSYRIRVSNPDTCNETYLEGMYYDEATKEWHTEWQSKNINGGELSYQYNLRPYTIPRTFTITFIYRRPGRCEWSWTTPAMPYIWTLDPAGKPDEDPDHIVGSGVATLFIRTMHTKWNERLHYPEGTTRDDFNAPKPEEGWSATITFGKGGDVDVPDFDDIAKIIGVSKEDIYNILEDNSITINGIQAKDLVEYIDKCDKRDLDHVHADLGFGTSSHGVNSFSGYNTVKEYIDAKFAELKTYITNLSQGLDDLIYGASIDDSGNITIPSGTKIPTGNINVFSGGTDAFIRTRAGEMDNDLKGM